MVHIVHGFAGTRHDDVCTVEFFPNEHTDTIEFWLHIEWDLDMFIFIFVGISVFIEVSMCEHRFNDHVVFIGIFRVTEIIRLFSEEGISLFDGLFPRGSFVGFADIFPRCHKGVDGCLFSVDDAICTGDADTILGILNGEDPLSLFVLGVDDVKCGVCANHIMLSYIKYVI